jgi:hypothetical protein
MVTSKEMRLAGHLTSTEENGNAYRLMVEKPDGERPLGRPKCRLVDNIKMDLGDTDCAGVDWSDLVQDRDQWRALVFAAIKLRVP